MSKITYIYLLSDPITNEIKYVGKSINPKERYRDHIKSGKKLKRRNLVNNWINSLIKNGLNPKMDVIDEIDGEWEWLEQYWISQIKCWGFNIKNMTLGGDSNPMNNIDARKKVSNFMKKMVRPKEWSENISKAKKNVSFHTEDSKKHLSKVNGGMNNPMYGKKHNPESLKKMGQPVLQYDLDDNFISRWDSCSEACRQLGGSCNPKNISSCAKGNRKSHYGYKWVYENKKGRG